MPNWCECCLEVEGPEAEVARFAAAARGAGPGYEPGDPDAVVDEFSFHSLYPVPDEVVAKDDDPTVDEWERANWGVKWGACRSQVLGRVQGRISYLFLTPWGPPTEFLDRVAAVWPGLTFSLKHHTGEVGERGVACWRGVPLSHNEDFDSFTDETGDEIFAWLTSRNE